MDELPEGIADRVEEIAEIGNLQFEEEGDWQAAIKTWEQGLEILPSPQHRWEASMWFYASIGDAYRFGGDHGKALEAFQSAYASAEGYVNPFVLSGIGMSLYDLGRKEDAIDPLLRTFMLVGDDIFVEEDEKYLDYLKSIDLV